MAAADTARLIASLELRDKEFQAAIKRSVGGVSTLEKRMDKIGSIAGRGLSNAARNTERAFVGLGTAAVAGIGASVKVAADFEAQLNTINTIARAGAPELKGIGDSIRKIARETGTSLDDLTAGYYDLLSAGIKTADAQNVLTAANQLAIGGLATTAESVDLLTTAINTYGGDATQAARYSDIFAKSVERGKVTAADLAASFAQVGPLAASLGIEIEELAAGYATLTAGGTEAGEASTQMASALTALLKKTPGLEKLEKATKKNYAAIAGSKGLNVALSEMRTDADKAGVALVDLVGRKEALLYILQTTGANLPKYNADLAAMGDAAGTAAGQMAERQQGLNFQLARLKALAKDAGITIGSALIPKLVPLFDKMAKFINEHQGDIQKLGDDLAKGLEGAAKWAGEIDWKTLGEGLKIGASSAKILIDAFLKAPAWLQGFLITGFAANKFTGGAIGGIIGELGKGLIKGVLGINAGVVNVTGKMVTGGGGIGPTAGAGGKGRLASVANSIGKVFLVGMAAGLAAELMGIRNEQSAANREQVTALTAKTAVYVKGASLDEMKSSLAGIESYQSGALAATRSLPEDIAYQLDIDGVKTAIEAQAATLRAEISAQTSDIKAGDVRQVGIIGKLDATTRSQLGGVINQVHQAGASAVTATSAVRSAVANVANVTRTGTQATAAAIRNKRWQFTVNNTVNTKVSIRDIVAKTTQTNTLGAVAS